MRAIGDVETGRGALRRWGMLACAATVLTLIAMLGATSAQAAVLPSVSAALYHTCAVKTDGLLTCWGGNVFGRANVPADLGTVTQVSAGGHHTCAIKTNATLSCWGWDGAGQSSVPSELGTVTQVSTGVVHTCAVRTDATLSCWGNNSDGQTGVPSDLGTVTQASAGGYHTCAVKSNATLNCWGNNSDGQSSVPSDLGTVTLVSSGQFHTCAVKTTGTLTCWGSNAFGQKGVPSDLGTVTQVSAGRYHTCAVKTDSTLRCWGSTDNALGSDSGQSNVPSDLGSVSQASAGGRHTCAARTNGSVICWGDNSSGQATVSATSYPSLSGALIDAGDQSGLDFGDVTAGLRSPILKSIVASRPVLAGVPLTLGTVSLSNTGGGAFQLLSPSCTAGQVLADGTGCALRVRFTPRIWQRGDVTGTITVTDDSLTGTHTIPLTGTALQPAAFTLQYAGYLPSPSEVEFSWVTSDASKVTITIAQPVNTTVKVKKGKKTVTKTVKTIKQLPVVANRSASAGPGTFTWNRTFGKTTPVRGIWAWTITARSSRGTATLTGKIGL